ncbi:APC family permease [Mycolicibacterium flavescens]|uniref:Amino acid permease n=1 Tax=Mycolicibacterium flavescens TaxID=1776 RepID=A0A1E3RJC9_MYCFV|nr:APC family permease [Mycolicibacterium flavescens]MCV7282245.1 APC family permease [Mycolicibacterium flavescens]ODQ89507.1 amino acid permease [Mycolicibacterium flavescens]
MERKTVEKPEDASLLKVLGNWDVLALGFGAMIGFGWVVLTGDWIGSAGTLGAVLAMTAGGVIMAMVGLTYAELTAAIPKAGGEHNFLLRGMGPRWSFIGSWGIVGGYVTIVAFEAVALPRTALYLFPDLNQVRLWEVAGSEVYLTWALVGAIAAVIITTINILGVKLASAAQTFVVLLLLIIALMLVVGSFTGGSTDDMQPLFTGGAAGFFAVLVVVPFLFVGFDVIPQSAEEVNVPARQVGRLVVIAVILATIFYLITIVTTASAMPPGELAEMDIATADAFGVLFGNDFMAKVLIAGGIAGILTSWNSLLLGASRLMYSMARSGMLPAWFGKLHPRFRTPINALLFIGGLSFLAPFLGEAMLGWLVDSGSPSIVITYLLVSIVFLILRRREPQMDRPLRVGGRGKAGLAIGGAAVVLCVGLLSLYLPGMPAFLDPQPWILFGAWWLLGAYFLFRIPTGIEPGEDAEHRLLEAINRRADER